MQFISYLLSAFLFGPSILCMFHCSSSSNVVSRSLCVAINELTSPGYYRKETSLFLLCTPCIFTIHCKSSMYILNPVLVIQVLGWSPIPDPSRYWAGHPSRYWAGYPSRYWAGHPSRYWAGYPSRYWAGPLLLN